MITIPQFIWDKYENIGDKYYIDLMIMVHHGFADAYHVKLFLDKFDEINQNHYIESLKKLISL